MIIRPNYLEKLKPFINVKLVKILAGIRRCGKSTILEMLKQELGITRESYNDYEFLVDSVVYKLKKQQVGDNPIEENNQN